MPKEYNVKPTYKQKQVAKILVENGGNVSKSMELAGYSKATSKTPQKLVESKGFKILCNELGLTDTFLVNALKEDIDKKPQDRSKELTLGFKVLGRLKADESQNTVPVLDIGDTDFLQIITAYKSRKPLE